MPTIKGRNGIITVAISVLLICSVAARQNSSSDRIRVVPNEGQRRVDIFIDGQAFTAYIWPEKLAKPVLFPLCTAKGTVVTRGFPLEPRPGDRVDHLFNEVPHKSVYVSSLKR